MKAMIKRKDVIKLKSDPISNIIEAKNLNVFHDGMRMVISTKSKIESLLIIESKKKLKNVILIRDEEIVSFRLSYFYEKYNYFLNNFFFGLNNATQSTETHQE